MSRIYARSCELVNLSQYLNSFKIQKHQKDNEKIPWEEVDYISASVLFGKWINRFAIFTKRNGSFTFSAPDNKQLLRAVRKYVPEERMYKSLNFFQVIGRGLKAIFIRK